MNAAINTRNLQKRETTTKETVPSNNKLGNAMLSAIAIFSATFYLFIFSTFVSSANVAEAQTGGTEIFELANLCKGHYPTQMHRKIDGAVIISKNDKNLECVVTFSAEYVSQRFLIRFVEFNMECGDRLHIYDSANAIGSSRAELSCRFLGPESIIPIKTSHYVTLKFTGDSWGTEANKFTMVITAFKDPSQGCRDAFVCGHDMCITNRLICDGTPNCLDGTDETSRAANCTSNFLDMLSSIDSPAEIGIVGGLIVIFAVIVVTCFCYCNRHRRRTPPQSPDIYNHGKSRSEASGASGSNGAGTMITLSDKPGFHNLHHHHQQNTLNWILPAETQGYNLRLRQCYMGN